MEANAGAAYRTNPRDGVSVWVSIAVKKHHDQGDFYKGDLIGTSLAFQRLRPLSSWWESRQPPGRHGARRDKRSPSLPKGRRRRLASAGCQQEVSSVLGGA